MSEQFIREIEEDLRRDKALKLWKRFGPWIIGAAVLVVVGVAADVAWRAWEENRRNEQASAYAAAEALAASGKQDQAAAAFQALAADAESGYAGLALMRAAEAKLAAGDRDGAQAGFESVAARGDLDPAIKVTATLKAASLAIRTETPDQIRARVSGLIDSEENWRPLAEELVALAAFKAGDTQRAGEIFARLADDADAPQDLRGRAASYARVLGAPIASEAAAAGAAPADAASTDADQEPAK
ncbi:tetratricopeptide repeat protein [Tistrella mobilis]